MVPSQRAEEGCGTDTGRKPLLGSELRFDGVTREEAKLGPLALPSSEQQKRTTEAWGGALMCSELPPCSRQAQ